MTLTPKSSIAGPQMTPLLSNTEPQLTPTHMPLPDSVNSTPVPSEVSAAPGVTQGSTDETARQLDELFGSLVNKR